MNSRNLKVTRHARERAIERLIPLRPFAILSNKGTWTIIGQLLTEMCSTTKSIIPVKKGYHYLNGQWTIVVDEDKRKILTIY